MSTATTKLEHVGVGCNRVVHALHWGDAGLLAYGGQNAVVVYHPEEARVLGTLLGHTDVVTCVRWLPVAAFEKQQQQHPGGGATAALATALASGSGDCSVRIWLWTPHTPRQPWRLAAMLQRHTAPITSVTTHALPAGGLLLVSTAGDGEALVWQCDAGDSSSSGNDGSGGTSVEEAVLQPAWRLRQRLALGHHLLHCAALAALPADPAWLLLALGGVDATVRLYLQAPGGQFEAVCKLRGHQDWIRGLDFAALDDGRLLLASASQDKNVRVWAITQEQQQQQQQQPGRLRGSDDVQTGAGAVDPPSLTHSLTRYAPKPLIRAGQHTYAAMLEALLIGHEDWVHTVVWHPRLVAPNGNGADGATTQPACLLSASMDRTMMLWRPDASTGMWMSEDSVGDAGANHLGYYTGVISPDGGAIAAHGFTGALHIWRRQPNGGWLPQLALGGHFAPVVDACWAADGGCLLTVSTDQTARITARLHNGHWCEIARPQVHGHDFSAVAALPSRSSSSSSSGGIVDGQQVEVTAVTSQQQQEEQRYLYASGSEEKVVRVFEAPRAFRDTLAMARGQQPVSGGDSTGGAALGALLPALGLSNKAVYREDEVAAGAEEGGQNGAVPTAGGGMTGVGATAYCEGPDLAPRAAPHAVAGPPLEEHLSQNTLWPEVHKLYGHGNDLYCLTVDPLGQYIASACRAQSADAAAIWLWDTSRWTGAGQLHAHTLTVTQLAFSPNGRFLASASRDRTVALFERQPGTHAGTSAAGAAAAAAAPGGDQVAGFRLVGRIKAHARIVWGLHWSPDSHLLATASRDGKVKVWSLVAGGEGGAAGGEGSVPLPSAPAATIACGDSVRSVQFAPDCRSRESYHLAAGLDSGAVQLLHLAAAVTATAVPGQLAVSGHTLMWETSLFERHAAAVRRLCWRRDGQGCYHLASCSEDHSLRVFAVTL